ncbi:FAD-dependent oxidoreductase [Clostridium sporogenes]|uniref:Pyridine nucleotide-disulfide oxidoreductase n=1 Tax=Clostridium botulinum TaxID=1491 RepID=A0A6M0SYS6_CLOBO|nr:DsrE/DsrF/DrsH-like family protein [Clostridium sporogenes]NFA60659.1 pyridine nucleotide-disulfide oxidoreductase [Clostridium botulinum]NFI74109.1 pyridine nucleotide-disulfide oxidoreductase [Clostridium sporogenes]NFL71823.1 pyridine nucleotide-disulfide oxidoreductase [Clostridium sporogenes]NFM23997.1 pyridine nucleotide-disulfide oxidoreductase [Clostridium sporogenes]NFP61983.1 pyridine nucleotide-disulfide oxidoreductase [Clostridium sporogenes]
MNKKVLIIGGVAGGASAAARLRRLDENAQIIMFERGEYISFANCGLPYYIGETIKERDNLLVQTPEAMMGRFNIDVRVNSEVTSIDTKEKKVTVNSKEKGKYEETYDYIIMSPGAIPIKPPIEGINNSKIFTLRNIPDTDKIKDYVDNKNVKSAVVVGGGYIGVEMAENLKERGINVVLVEAAPHILAPFDSEMVTFAEQELQDNGVGLILGDGVKSFHENNNKIKVSLQSGTELNVDIVILAIGVKPDTQFLKGSSIEIGPRGHIIVDKHMKTNVEGIYAVGDAIEVVDYINENKTAIPLAGPANKQGRIAADNIFGLNSSYKGTQGTAIIKVFGLTGASTGNNERALSKFNIPYEISYTHSQSHASYYPGATQISLKLIFDTKGKILGAQAFGYDGVDKRIDDIATVIRFGGTIYDLEELELAYAPPYSSAKDPVNMIGFVAENLLTGKVETVLSKDIDNRDKNKVMLLDVRDDIEIENGKLEGAIEIPINQLRNRLSEIPKDKEVWIYCQIGLRGYIAARILMANGYKVKNLNGGYKTYIMNKFIPKKIHNILQNEINETKEKVEETLELDACGLSCPGPLMKVNNTVNEMNEGETLKIKASDPGFYIDIQSWCERTDNELLSVSKDKGIVIALIKKGKKKLKIHERNMKVETKENDNKTLVVFSGDLDKAIASFVIANGAMAMGKKVTMFFTFWGLNILRKPEKAQVQKGFMDKMFASMMPRGSKKLKLSKMNMMGMGSKMIRKVMKNKNISSLEELIQSAIDSGINIVACQMSMDVMGIKEEELIDGVNIGGVGYYLGEAEDSNVNLFI